MICRYPLATFFALSYGISWLLWAPLWLPALGIDKLPVLPFQHALGASGPIGAAFLVSALEGGLAGPRDLMRRMILWRGRLCWVAVALLLPFVLLVLAVMVESGLNDASVPWTRIGASREFPQFSALGFLAYNILSFGFGEEVGWRGFGLPRLQSRHTALVATLLLTVGWALWHLPLFFYRPGYTSMGAAGIAGWFFSLLTGAVLLTWLYNESRGSVLVVALFHAAIDVAFTSSASSPFVINATGALITFWGVAVIAVAGHRYLSKGGKVVRLSHRGAVTAYVRRDAADASHTSWRGRPTSD
jgi:membrane protease YdiL (CAAX protease family)